MITPIALWMEDSTLQSTTILLACGLIVVLLAWVSASSLGHSRFPLANRKRPFDLNSIDFMGIRAKLQFVKSARELIKRGFQTSKSFLIDADFGPTIILSPEYAQELKSDSNLSFVGWVSKSFHGHIPGFEPFTLSTVDREIFQEFVSTKATHSLSPRNPLSVPVMMSRRTNLRFVLGGLTDPLKDETDMALREVLSENLEWHEIPLRENIVKAVARISSRVFVGEELCHNSAWLQITIEYAVNAFIAAVILRMWPEMLRPVIHWFLPPCRTIRKQLSKANNMINQIIMQRRQRRTAAALEKVPSEQPRDTMDWLEEIAQGRDYHPAIPQLMLALATVHTTSDLLTQVLIDLCQHKELFQPLREEIRMILQTDGWKRSSLYKMKLLDSVIKESQRLKPESMVSMRRVVLNDITLSDGTELHKGDTVAVSSHRMWDPEVYPNPEQFDGYRFLKMRDIPGKEHVSQLVSTSPDHLGFGYGKHACPGRFFVANEIKIALCHLLLQYDWMIPEGHEPKTMVLGFSLVADPRAKILVRRRREDMPI